MRLSTLPNTGLAITSGIGNLFSGAAISFSPQNNGNLTGVTMLLSGYNGLNGQDIYCQFCGNQFNGVINIPNPLIGSSLNCPPPNDGSLALFKFTAPAGANLVAGQIYWIHLYGKVNAHMAIQTSLTWVAGDPSTGDIQYQGSLSSALNNFTVSTVRPAFSIEA